ncbi:chemokine XC receptor 1-like [Austrofundulus limnaeus]|uniref:Chemokine XC receptor 1-like n=1 Tax=Austrofundulus limnaeus TaxID=52670 RepID=A0A2I4C1G0_AUSLI|nr:PREDICTED: chemokine XC receptor 1-like [Austrofundulus limnaeus]
MATSDYYMDNTTFDYTDKNDSDECDQTSVIHFGATFTPLFFSIVIILSLFGNILVLVTLFKYENLKSLTNTFILNLAVSDLFFTAGLPFWANYHMLGIWNLGQPVCVMINFIFYVGFYSSGFLLILMTIHRYVAVMNPLSDIVSASGLSSVVATVIIWVVSILAGSPAFYFIKADESYCGFDSKQGRIWGTYQQNLLFIMISVVFVFCYSQILFRLLHPSAQRRRNKTVKLIFTLMIVFFVGWGPYNVVIFLKSLSLVSQQPLESTSISELCQTETNLNYAFYVSRLLAFSHCCLNPVFYVFMGVKFKTHLKKMLRSWGSNHSGNIRSRSNRLTITSQMSGEDFSM